MKKLLIVLLSLCVLFAFNISSFAYFTTEEYINYDTKSYMPDADFLFETYDIGTLGYSENLSIFASDGMLYAIDNELFEGGEYLLSHNYLHVQIEGYNQHPDVAIEQNINLFNILPSELQEKYDYVLSREYILEDYLYRSELVLHSPVVKLSEEFNDIRFYFQNHMNISCSGYFILYNATTDGFDSTSVSFDVAKADDFIYMSDLIDLDYEEFDFCEFVIHFSWQPEIDKSTGRPLSPYSRLHIEIPLSIPDNGYPAFLGIQEVNNNDLVVNVQSINDFNFLEWLANSVQSFFSVTLFRIGSVPVSVGVCMLVPLSLSILIGFLKKFSGG